MSIPTAPITASPYFERLLRYLIPYFTGVTPDLQAARVEALETLVSYGGRTRAELMNAVQVIILGFSTLETLGEAKTTDMSPSMRLRFRGCANNLNSVWAGALIEWVRVKAAMLDKGPEAAGSIPAWPKLALVKLPVQDVVETAKSREQLGRET